MMKNTTLLLLMLSTNLFAGSLPTQLSIAWDSPDPSEAGVGFMVTVQLEAVGEPTGSIEITDGSSSCTVLLPEDACLFRTEKSGQTIELTAEYSGDSSYSASTSAVETHTIAAKVFPERITVGNGGLGNGYANSSNDTNLGGLSNEGRYLAFDSPNILVPEDTNNNYDVYVYDRIAKTYELISLGHEGSTANGNSYVGNISSDGRYLVLHSYATNLTNETDSNNDSDVFLYDRDNQTTTRLSKSNGAIQGDNGSYDSTISADGLWVSFQSDASNLTAESDGSEQIYLYDVNADSLLMASKNTSGDAANSFSNIVKVANGGVISFRSNASDLVLNDNNSTRDSFLYLKDSDSVIRYSVDENGNELSGGSFDANISGNGEFAFFESSQTVLATDTDGLTDIFRYEIATGSLLLVSTDGLGANTFNAGSSDAFSSFDGSIVVFETDASSVDAFIDDNDETDVFVKNLNTNEVIRASFTLDGQLITDGNGNFATGISDDGAWVAFTSSDNIGGIRDTHDQLYLSELNSGEMRWVGAWKIGEQSNSGVEFDHNPQFAAGNNLVIFESKAMNISEDFTSKDGASSTVFIRDRITGETEILLKDLNGNNANNEIQKSQITSDGRYVVFDSRAENLVFELINPNDSQVFLLDRNTDTLEWISRNMSNTEPDNNSNDPDISDDGRWVVWRSAASDMTNDDNNGRTDVFLLDRNSGDISLVSKTDPSFGAVTSANNTSTNPKMSADGNVVFFESTATDLITGDTLGHKDIFAYTVSNDVMERISLTSDGLEVNEDSELIDISSDGRFVLFVTDANNVINNDTNGEEDIFLRDRLLSTTVMISQDSNGTQSISHSVKGCVSDDGNYASFRTEDISGLTTDTFTYIRDVQNSTTAVAALNLDGEPLTNLFVEVDCFSNDGHFFLARTSEADIIVGDTNPNEDIYMFINPLNNATPVATDDNYQINEGQQLIIEVSDNNDLLDNDSDADADPVSIIDADLLSLSGDLTGALQLGRDGAISFIPDSLDENGTGSLQYTITDGQASDSATLTIEVLPINDKPSFMVSDDVIITTADSGKVTVSNWATFDPGASNESDQISQYIVSNVSDLSQFDIAPQVSANGNLFFATASDASGAVTFEVFVRDTGGTANGGEDSSDSIIVTIITNAYTVGGSLTGLLPNQAVVIRNNGTDEITLTSNGEFVFSTALGDGSSYAVTIESEPVSPIQHCVLMAGNGTINGQSIMDVEIICDSLDLIFKGGFEDQ